MSGVGVHDEDAVTAALDALDTALDSLIESDVDALSHHRLLQTLNRLERVRRRLSVPEHRIVNRLAAEANPIDLGANTMTKLLGFHLRISTAEAGRRIHTAADLGPRRTLTGESLAPKLAHTAAAQVRGEVNAEHIKVIRGFLSDLPDAVDYQAREAAEADLARVAAEQSPEGLGNAADLLLALLHPDGEYTDAERERRRGITVSNQGADGMSRITGWLTPEARATWEAVMAKWAAPGMCNPADEHPTVDGEPDDAAVDKDSRSPAQRQHDALLAMGRSVLCSGQLGQLNGLPVTIIVSTTLQQLESGAGYAVTAGGTRLPIPDMIRMASPAYHYLAVFDKHTEQALYLGRTRRCASGAQRIVLYAKDRGCTRPGCMASGYRCQVHHAVADWKNNGQTDINDLTLACGPDNLLIENTEWTTRRRKDGWTEWIPPPHLDSGQARVNDFHHPERMLRPPEGNPDQDEDPV